MQRLEPVAVIDRTDGLRVDDWHDASVLLRITALVRLATAGVQRRSDSRS
jgi:hypothetical protein